MQLIDTWEMTILGVFLWSVLFFSMPHTFAQEIPITISPNMNHTIFDGKWSFYTEWKPTSSDTIPTNSGAIYIRSAHLENYIYILLDVVPDKTLEKNDDHAFVCFDAQSDQSEVPDSNDYCFVAKSGSEKPTTLQGSEKSKTLEEVHNPPGLIAIGGFSDENDRHSRIPHSSYEFRIPIDHLQRTDHYGFFVKIFDNNNTNSKVYTWPPELNLTSDSKEIASPAKWGVIYSPDKSMPEYDLPILVLILGIFSTILLSIRNRGYTLLKIRS